MVSLWSVARAPDERCHDAPVTCWHPARRCGRTPRYRPSGADILNKGGSAVDAAVAMMLVSCAAETIFTGLGGGGFATVYDAATVRSAVSTSSSRFPAWAANAPGPGWRSK